MSSKLKQTVERPNPVNTTGDDSGCVTTADTISISQGIDALSLDDSTTIDNSIVANRVATDSERVNTSSVAKCFSNDLIMENLLAHLDHTSVKFLSCTSQTIRSFIRSNRKFLDKTQFCVVNPTKSAIEEEAHCPLWYTVGVPVDLSFLKDMDFPWTSLKVELDCLDAAALEILTPHLSGVINLKCDIGGMEMKAASVRDILLAATSVKRVVIAQCLLELTSSDQEAMTSDTAIKATFGQLDSFHVISGGFAGMRRYPLLKFEIGVGETVVKLLGLINTLKSFSFNVETDPNSTIMDPEFVKRLLCLIKSHSGTMTSVYLHNWAWNSDNILDIVFPNLTELHVQARGETLPRIAKFLENHAQLMNLEVNLDSGVTMSPQPLVKVLVSRFTKLKNLSLAWKLDPPRAHPYIPGPPLDFSWLKSLATLTGISIRQFSGEYRDNETLALAEDILPNLPAGMREINLAGLRPLHEIRTDLMLESLGRLGQLNVLNLAQCPEMLNDEILQFIASSLTNLRELKIHIYGSVSGLGLAALGSLKALRKLGIHGFTNCEFLTGLALPELQELQLGFEMDLLTIQNYENLFKGIVEQNRMLERIGLESLDFICLLGEVLSAHSGRIIRVEEIHEREVCSVLMTQEDVRAQRAANDLRDRDYDYETESDVSYDYDDESYDYDNDSDCHRRQAD